MKITQSLASLYQTQVPTQKRNNKDDPAAVTPSNNNSNQRTEKERVVAGEVLRNQPPSSDEIYNKSQVFQQSLFRESFSGSTSSRQAIASYEGHTDIRKEGKTGEFVDLFV